MTAPCGTRVDEDAIARFTAGHGDPALGPITVIIPAYREAGSIAAVLGELPKEIAGVRVSTLVVIDGEDDGTNEIARSHGAYVCVVGVRRGQGATLRLGYRIALAHGSEVLVTIDADGQYVAHEMLALVDPLLRGEADFASGSRRLGADHTTDRVRSLGIDVFAHVIRTITGHPVTDPAFGLRAMTAEVARAVTLTEPQYQAAELLLGAILRGFRVIERPATMRKRTSAQTRKGGNLNYGVQFARVVLKTWWRERGTGRGR